MFETLQAAVDILRQSRGLRETAAALVPALRERRVLNLAALPEVDEGGAVRALRRARNELKGHLSDGKFDYASVRSSGAYARLQALAPVLRETTPEDLPTDADRIAFFLNVYNVLALHGVIALDIQKSVMEVPAFFDIVAYDIGDAVLSLNEMENGVLRLNAGHPATGRPTLPADHPGHGFAPSYVEPRIHASLVCASTSCPAVGFYDPEHLEAQLDLATRHWVNADVRVVGGELHLPAMFRWYEADFGGGKAGVEAFVLHHADPPLRDAIDRAIHAGARHRHTRYDWSLNRL